VKGLEALYDVLNIHTYSLAEMWPSWRRSYPEDTSVNFVKPVTDLIAWRDQNARGKEIWITEFGWDASTKPNMTTGDNAKWKGNVSDERQAQYLVRSYLVFSALAVDRAYMYFFNDQDEPAFHAASGVTRNFHPKPSFHAMAHLYRTLGDYRLSRVAASRPGELFVYEYVHGTDAKRKVLVAWSPTGADRKATAEIPLGRGKLLRAQRMPLVEGDGAPVEVPVKAGTASIAVEESPLYLWLQE
jgi:serine/threonine-protein kinase ATR